MITKDASLTPAYTARDAWICLLLILAILLTVAPGLNMDMNWGDDFAAYISYAIAISDGTLEEQAERNFTLHPTQLPSEAEGKLYYVWGFPLLLVPVYRAVGFDRTDYHTILYYKLPGLFLLSFTCAIVFLFFRKRFSRTVSALLALAICGSDFVLSRTNLFIGTDILFFCLSVGLYLVHELFLEARERGKQIAWGVLLGLLLWYCCETRLNGVIYLPFLLLSHTLYLHRTGAFRDKWPLSRVIIHCTPYLVFLVFWFGSSLVLPAATSNNSDYNRFRLKKFFIQCLYYGRQTCVWLGHILLRPELPFVTDVVYFLLGAPLLFAAGYGLVRYGSRENTAYSMLLIGSVLGTSALPYTVWDLRYLFNILPLVCLFAVFGLRDFWGWVCRKRHAAGMGRSMRRALLLLLTCWMLSLPVQKCFHGYVDPEEPSSPYEADSIQVWRYIQDETPEDCRIFFRKPRCLYLNTGRMGFTAINGHTPMDADYCLVQPSVPPEEDIQGILAEHFSPVFENATFVLYQRNP